MRTLYQLSEIDFEFYLDRLEWRDVIMAKAKRRTEQLAVKHGFSFPDNYQYVNQNVKVYLLCCNNHLVSKMPSSLSKNFRCSKCISIGSDDNIVEMRNAKAEKKKADIEAFSKKKASLNDLVCSNGSGMLDIIKEVNSNRFLKSLDK